jgi:hypothetical protein
MKKEFNRWLYLGFVLFGTYLLLLRRDLSESAIYFGIALAFDPFDQKQPWQERPIWQRILLILHLALVFFLFILGVSPDFAKGFRDGFEGR